MTVRTTTHLNFRGDAREALEFYRSVSGGESAIITYEDAGNVDDPDEADQVMWGQVESADGFHVMAFDVPSARPWSRGDDPFYVSVRGTDEAGITRLWAGLAQGGDVVVPLAPAQWSPLYGMVRDRFGITWVLDVAVAYAG